MEQRQKRIEEQNKCSLDFKVCTRQYSEKVLGYRVIIEDETVFFVNNAHPRNVQEDTMDRLFVLSDRYIESGFILLLSNYELYVCPHFKYSDIHGRYMVDFLEVKKDGNVIQFDKTLFKANRNKKIINHLKGLYNID